MANLVRQIGPPANRGEPPRTKEELQWFLGLNSGDVAKCMAMFPVVKPDATAGTAVFDPADEELNGQFPPPVVLHPAKDAEKPLDLEVTVFNLRDAPDF